MKKSVAYINRESSLTSEFINNLQPYSPTSSLNKIKDSDSNLTPLKLDWNEATVPPSPKVKETLIQSLMDDENVLNWYPELFSEKLRTKLKKYTGRNRNEILVTNGSDDALELICKVFLDPGDHVVTQYPTYTHFLTYVESRGAIIKKAQPENVFTSNISSLIEKITDKTKLIYIVNPNNPTGVLLSDKEVETVLKIAKNAMVIVDEAYVEFSGNSVAHLLDRYSNLIITRTFSKAWALAGLRVGYALASNTVIHLLSRILNPKSVNVLAQKAALAALEDIDYMKKYVKEVHESKRLLKSFFDNRDIVTFNGRGNFIMVQYPNLQLLLDEMEKMNVYVRDRSSFAMLPDFFRVNLGTVEQTKELIERLNVIFDRLQKK